MRRTTAALTLALVASTGLAACGGGDKISEQIAEKAIESQGGGDVDLDIGDDGSVKVETSDGTFSADEDGNITIESEDGTQTIDSDIGGELPDDFPDLPLPDGFEPTSSSVLGDGTEKSFLVNGTADGTAQEIFAGYGAKLEAAGYSADGVFENSGGEDYIASGTYLKPGEVYAITVSVATSGGETNVALTIIQPG